MIAAVSSFYFKHYLTNFTVITAAAAAVAAAAVVTLREHTGDSPPAGRAEKFQPRHGSPLPPVFFR